MTLPPIEEHPLSPFLPPNARVLMLGSFPPKREKWAMHFYYPNFQNDMWRIMGLLFFNDKYHFLHSSSVCFHQQRIMDFLSSEGIALGDAATKVRRLQDNASDKFLDVVETLDIASTLEALPECTHIITTGEKSASVIANTLRLSILPRIASPISFDLHNKRYTFHRLPSSSRAYPISIEKKVTHYRDVFHTIFPERIPI